LYLHADVRMLLWWLLPPPLLLPKDAHAVFCRDAVQALPSAAGL